MIGLIYLEVFSSCRPFEEELCRNKGEIVRIKVPRNNLHCGTARQQTFINQIFQTDPLRKTANKSADLYVF